MKAKKNSYLLVAILICLVIIIFNLNNTQTNYEHQDYISTTQGETVLQLAPNRIAVVDTTSNSGMNRVILVFEFNETEKIFEFIGSFDYSDYFSNRTKYGL